MRIVFALLLAPTLLGAQDVVIRNRGTGHGAALIDSIVARPHVIRSGSGPLVFPRDSTITASLIVIGRPTYLASKVQGDVIVIGSDLFLRPGVEITGRAIAIGGTVAVTTLGTVAGGVQSLRDETFDVANGPSTGPIGLSARDLRVGGSDSLGLFHLAGIKGVKLPSYDRVDGLSLPVGVQLLLNGGAIALEPTITYRSRLGAFDPALAVRVGPESGTRFEGRVARETRTNDAWITSELINSLKTFAFGTDTRNYFRSNIAEGRLFKQLGGASGSFAPFIGGRFERVSPVTATGDVYSILYRADSDKVRRPNPLVEPGDIGSVLAGILYQPLAGESPVAMQLVAEAEQSFVTPAGTQNFTQLTLDGSVEFPTFGTQHLRIRGHAMGTLGDAVPLARYGYLGGSRTLALADLLEYGGSDVLFVESRYFIPVNAVMLPVVGAPIFSLIHRIGGAGVGSLGTLQQEVGLGLSLGPLDFDVITGASGQHATHFGVGVSVPSF